MVSKRILIFVLLGAVCLFIHNVHGLKDDNDDDEDKGFPDKSEGKRGGRPDGKGRPLGQRDGKSREDFERDADKNIQEKLGTVAKNLFDKLKDKIDTSRLGLYGLEKNLNKLKELSQEKRDKLIAVAGDGEVELDEDDVEDLAEVIMNLVEDDDRLKSLAANFSVGVRAVFCRKIASDGVAAEKLERILRLEIDCDEEIGKKLKSKLSKGQKRVIVTQKMKNKRPEDFDEDDVVDLLSSPDIIDEEMIEKMKESTFGKFAKKFMEDAPPKAKKGVVKRVMKSLGAVTGWSKEKVKEALDNDVIDGMDDEDTEKIPVDALVEACGKKVKDKGKAKQIRRRINKEASVNKTSIDDVKKKLSCLPSEKLAEIDDNILAEAFEEDTELSDDGERSMAAKKLKGSDAYKDGKFTLEEARNWKNAMGGLRPEDLDEKLEPEIVEKLIENLKNAKGFSQRHFAVIVKKYMKAKNKDEFDVEDVRKLGPLASGLTPEELKKIPGVASLIFEVDSPIQDFVKNQMESILDMVRGDPENKKNMDKILRNKDVSKYLTTDDFEDMKAENVVNVVGNATEIEFSKKQAKSLMKIIRDAMGKFDGFDWTPELFLKLGPILKAMSKGDVEELPVDDDLLAKLESLAENIDDMDEETCKAFVEKIKELFDWDNRETIPEFDELAASQVGRFAVCMEPNDLNKLTRNVTRRVLEEIGKNLLKKFRKTICEKWAERYMKYVERNGAVEDRSASSEFDEYDVINMGGLKRCMTLTVLRKLTRTALEENYEELQDTTDMDKRKALAQRYKSIMTDFKTKREILVKMGNLLIHLSRSEMRTIDREEFRAAISDIADALMELEENRKDRDDAGYTDEASAGDRTEMDEGTGSIAEVATEVLTDEAAKRRRRRRSTNPLTCSEVRAMKNLMTSLQDIGPVTNMVNTEFEECLEYLGEQTWKPEHLSALANKAKNVLGSTVSTYTTDQVRQIGSIAAGFTAQELSQLSYDQSAIYSLGKHALYSAEQREKVFIKWLADTQSSQISQVAASELQNLGQFACGLKTTHISGLSNDAYSVASSNVGELKSCSSTQKQSYANKAKAAWGAVTTWSDARIGDIGHVLSGLSDSEIAALTQNQFQSIEPYVIKEFPKEKFKMFSKTALSSMLTAQANEVSQEQFDELSEDKKTVVNGKRASKLDTSAGNTVTSMSLLVTLMAVAAALLNRY